MNSEGSDQHRGRYRKGLHLLALFALLAFVATLSAGPEPATAKTGSTFDLGAGDAQFWDGEFVEHANVYDPSKCDVLGPCWEYKLNVTEEAWRLRVGFNVEYPDPSYVRYWADHLNFDTWVFAQDTVFNIRLYDPDGNLITVPREEWPEGEISEPTVTTDYGYSREIFVDDPAVGEWTVKVRPVRVHNMGFRMRAKLETAPEPPAETGEMNPNLRVIPPSEVNFNTVHFTYGPSMANDGDDPSCMEEEWIEADEHGDEMTGQCIRFTAGIENVGPGPVLMMATCNDFPFLRHPDCKEKPDDGGEFGAAHEGHGGEEETVLMYQRRLIQKADGSKECCVEEEVGSAGVAEYHDFHGHFHWEDMYVYELYRVAGDRGWHPNSAVEPKLEFIRDSNKRGFWPWDELLADWDKFYQSQQDEAMPYATLRISAGWGDTYEYNRGGQFVAFPVNENGEPESGYYLIRGHADPEGKVIETTKDDNVSYALVKVGSPSNAASVELLERGYGSDPWDPDKEVLTTVP